MQWPALWVTKALSAIPVYNDAAGIMNTLNESVSMLKQGVSIAVFADKSGDHFDERVGEGKKSGCVYLGHFYVRRAKEPLLFYPVHISRKRREIAVGEPIAYCSANTAKNEVKRVSDYLSRAIQELGRK